MLSLFFFGLFLILGLCDFLATAPLHGEKICVCYLRSQQLTLEVTLLPTDITTKCPSVMKASDYSVSQARVPNKVLLGFCTLVLQMGKQSFSEMV